MSLRLTIKPFRTEHQAESSKLYKVELGGIQPPELFKTIANKKMAEY